MPDNIQVRPRTGAGAAGLEFAAPQTLGQVRVVDPILSNVARGYRHAAHIWPILFPLVLVMQRAGKIITFGKESFRRYNAIRAPGSTRLRLNFGYEADDYLIQQIALDGQEPREHLQEAAAVPGIDVGHRASQGAMAAASLQIEYAASKLAATAGNYSAAHRIALVGSSQWSHADSNPADAVITRKELIAKDIGMEPNILVLGISVYRTLCSNEKVIDRIKHMTVIGKDDEAVVNEMTLAAYFKVPRVVVGVSRYYDDATEEFKAMWDNVAILAYSDVSSLAEAEGDMGKPSFGYAYRLRNFPEVQEPWFDKTCDSWIYPVTEETQPVIAGKDAGVIFTNVVNQ